MTISTDAAIHVFGTQDTLGTSSAAVADAAFSIAADLSTSHKSIKFVHLSVGVV